MANKKLSWTVKDNTSKIIYNTQLNMQAAMDALAEEVVEDVQWRMLYGYHTPHGADGHTEIVDTGKLYDSIESTVNKESQNLITANVGTRVDYAPFVHDGTVKLEARPFITDTLTDETNQANYETTIATNLKKGF